MFKGKVVIYKTDPRTWKVYHIEREFDNPEDYEKFISSYKDFFNVFDIYNENLGFFDSLGRITKFLDNLRLDGWIKDEAQSILDKYEKKLRDIQKEIEEKDNKKRKLIDALKKLNQYKEEFKNLWKEEIVKQIEEDILKIENELRELW